MREVDSNIVKIVKRSAIAELFDEENEALLSRKQVASRWYCSLETVKRREAAGLIHPLRFSKRQLRYRLSEIRSVERAAAGGAA
jgi:hypothetical protein